MAEQAAKTTTATKKPAVQALPKEVFGVKVNTQAIFDVIMSERSSRRQGTHSTKTRGEVSGGGKRPWRQKGTGNARQGSIRSPQWVGGGIVWGPRPNKNYELKVNKKVRRLAFNSALTLKAKEKAVITHNFKVSETPSTSKLLKEIEGLKLKKEFKKVLIITSSPVIWKSASNLPKVYATKLSGLTVEAIVNADVLIVSKEDMKKLGGK